MCVCRSVAVVRPAAAEACWLAWWSEVNLSLDADAAAAGGGGGLLSSTSSQSYRASIFPPVFSVVWFYVQSSQHTHTHAAIGSAYWYGRLAAGWSLRNLVKRRKKLKDIGYSLQTLKNQRDKPMILQSNRLASRQRPAAALITRPTGGISNNKLHPWPRQFYSICCSREITL